jgi:hypothetical protein
VGSGVRFDVFFGCAFVFGFAAGFFTAMIFFLFVSLLFAYVNTICSVADLSATLQDFSA